MQYYIMNCVITQHAIKQKTNQKITPSRTQCKAWAIAWLGKTQGSVSWQTAFTQYTLGGGYLNEVQSVLYKVYPRLIKLLRYPPPPSPVGTYTDAEKNREQKEKAILPVLACLEMVSREVSAKESTSLSHPKRQRHNTENSKQIFPENEYINGIILAVHRLKHAPGGFG